MIKKTLIGIFATIALFCNSCNKEQIDNKDITQPEGQITYSIEALTETADSRLYLQSENKGSYGTWQGVWEDKADTLGLFNSNNNFSIFTISELDQTNTCAVFSTTASDFAPNNSYTIAIFPSSIIQNKEIANAITNIQIKLDQEQTYRKVIEGNTYKILGPEVFPAYSYAAEKKTHLRFKNILGIMNFRIYANDTLVDNNQGYLRITEATLVTPEQKIAGIATFDFSTETPSFRMLTNHLASNSLTIKTNTDNNNSPIEFTTSKTDGYLDLYFAVPPGEYKTIILKLKSKADDRTFYRKFVNNPPIKIERSKSKIISVRLVDPVTVEYQNVHLYWGNDDINNDGIIDVHGQNYVFKLNKVTAKEGDVFLRLPVGMIWAGENNYDGKGVAVIRGNGSAGNPVILQIKKDVAVELDVYIAPTLRQGDASIRAYIDQSDAVNDTDMLKTIPVTWNNRLGYAAGILTGIFSATPTRESVNGANSAAGNNWATGQSNGSIVYTENTNVKMGVSSTTQMRTNEALFTGIGSDGSSSAKLFMQQNEFAFTSGGIIFNTDHYELATSGSFILFNAGYLLGVKNTSTVLQEELSASLSSTPVYIVNTSTGKVTQKTWATMTSAEKLQPGDPCTMISNPALYAYRYMEVNELKVVQGNFTKISNYQIRLTYKWQTTDFYGNGYINANYRGNLTHFHSCTGVGSADGKTRPDFLAVWISNIGGLEFGNSSSWVPMVNTTLEGGASGGAWQFNAPLCVRN